jgi:hypothetical protein
MDTATPTKQNVTDRELDPTKPQSTGNDKFKTQLSTETLPLVTINIEGFHLIVYCRVRDGMIGGAPVRCLSRIFGGRGWNTK